ncbi:hypothetical protein [Aminobacter aganoensis]|uniref:hypothetical protein n=1 Tax=Aminobacter aganoensis TaxID=83264 RepID=UPI003CD0B8BA
MAVQGMNSSWRRAAAFFGPGYLVAVGYMDPGNWATSIAGGALRIHAAGGGPDLQHHGDHSPVALRPACDRFGKGLGTGLQGCLPEGRFAHALGARRGGDIATDIAEVIGTAIGLNLLFGIRWKSAS